MKTLLLGGERLASRCCFGRALLIASLIVACIVVGHPSVVRAEDSDQDLLHDAQSQFEALPTQPASGESHESPQVVELGRKLFFDPRLSVDGTVSCMRCHQAGLYATDALPKARGAHEILLPRNAQTVLNSGLYFAAHWDGRFKSVEDQAKHALTGLGLANADFAAAMDRINGIPGYAELFRQAFPKDAAPVSADNFGKAVGAYERTLTTPSRFDEFLNGKVEALSAAERQGLRTFIEVGCATCHNGIGIGGNSYEKFGVFLDYWKETNSKPIDEGRFDVTHNSDDRYVFKVPGLRNVAMTAPYFHDGSVYELEKAVKIMAKVQLDQTPSDADVASIIAFLNCLTGTLPNNYANAPVLPPAGYVPPSTGGRADASQSPVKE